MAIRSGFLAPGRPVCEESYIVKAHDAGCRHFAITHAEPLDARIQLGVRVPRG